MLQPYRIPTFNRLAEMEGFDFKVALLSVREANREWDVEMDRVRFDYEILPSWDWYIRALNWGFHLNRGVRSALDRFNPDVIVGTGYTSPTYFMAQNYSRSRGLGYVLWSGSTRQSSLFQKGFFASLKKRFVRRCDAYLAYGTDAADLLADMGADRQAISVGRNAVDIEYFAELANAARAEPEYAAWRSQFPPRLILYVGQMVERKGVLDLVEAFRLAGRKDLGLMLLGSGSKSEEYRQQAHDLENVHWFGYVQSPEMGRFLAAADILAMPSYLEPWGLVVNEAMAAGVPVVSTTCSGATIDLVSDGVTGHSFEAGDLNRLSELLTSVCEDPQRWERMGREAAERIQLCGPREYAAAFVDACRLALREEKT
jgi:glycosyltransferase involved in cell wall biosynthesis